MILIEHDLGDGAGMLFYERLPDGERGHLVASLDLVDVKATGVRYWRAHLIRNDMTVRGRNRDVMIASVHALADGGLL